MKIGVFICKCGANISSVIDCDAVRDYASKLPGVVCSNCSDYLCSPSGLSRMREVISDSDLTSVVIAACTPRICERIFRENLERAGINRHMLYIANIREQCSWVHVNEPFEATQKAKDLVKMGVERATTLTPLECTPLELKQEVVVIGGGVAGVEAAYKLAELGFKVHLVERRPVLGGNMATMFTCLLWCHEAPGGVLRSHDFRHGIFPACDCSGCTITSKLNDVVSHPNIEIYLLSEVVDITGHVGNFKVRILKKPRFIDEQKCVGCGNCAIVCPVVKKNEYDYGLSERKAIFMPFQQAIPRKFLIDTEACLRLNGKECSACVEACEFEAPNFEDKTREITIEAGAIIIATGFEPFKPKIHGYLGYQEFENVITIMELERMLDKAGPTGGMVIRPSDKKVPKKIAFIQCVGSRDRKINAAYCSKVCCMYTMKNAQAVKEVHPDTDITVYYIDIRAVGKGVEEFFHRTREDYGVEYTRGRPARIIEDKATKNLIVRAEETLLNKITERMYELVVLSVAMIPSKGSNELASMLRLRTSPDGFIQEAHTRTKPVETSMEGVFICGCAQGPKDVPESIAQARAAALEVAILLSKKMIMAESLNAYIEEERCLGCGLCVDICPYGAPTTVQTERGVKMRIVDALCKGCGTCVVSCPAKAIHARQFTDEQILSEIRAALEVE